MMFLTFVFLIVVSVSLYTLIGAAVVYGMAAMGLVKFSWAASFGVGVVMAFVSGVLDRSKEQG